MKPTRATMLLAFTASVCAPVVARAIELNLAGSLQLDYLYTPFSGVDPRPARGTLDGLTQEFSLKLAVDINDHVSANVKACYGCHGFEMAMAYADFRVADELNFRVGRIVPTFGEFGLRHDPGNHRLSDKPLPYDMGRMLRLQDFDRSVLPSPYVDNGVEVSGSHFFGQRVQLDYAAHIVSGLRANGATPAEVDWSAMHSAAPYYVDNNSEPAFGGRLGATVRIAERVDLSLGASAMYGHYDDNGRLPYLLLGADVYLRLGRTNVRGEYLIRRTDMAVGDPARFQFALPTGANGAPSGELFQVRDGWYVEVEQPLGRRLDLVLRWDGMRRRGNVLTTSQLGFDAGVTRWTLGANFVIERGYRVKASVEYYTWWGLASGVTSDVAAHLGAVATF